MYRYASRPPMDDVWFWTVTFPLFWIAMSVLAQTIMVLVLLLAAGISIGSAGWRTPIKYAAIAIGWSIVSLVVGFLFAMNEHARYIAWFSVPHLIATVAIITWALRVVLER
jgi:hypothetical protein